MGCQEDGAVFNDFKDFSDRELEREKCLTDIRNRMIEDYKPFFENVTQIALIDVALHGNLGDSILWRAAIHIATWFGHTVDYVCASSQAISGHLRNFPRCNMDRLIKLTKKDGLIMYAAGGNWGNLYRFVQNYRIEVFAKLATAYRSRNATFKVVQLPQSIAYTSNGQKSINADDNAMNNLPAGMFTLLMRQDDSYLWAKEHYGDNIDIKMSPDAAFALGQLTPIGEPIMDVVLIMRNDNENVEKHKSVKAEVGKRFKEAGLTYSFQGYNYEYMSTEYASAHPTIISEVRLNSAIKTISKGRLLITNRFHGHVVGMMMGRTTFWIDTVQKKLMHARTVAFNSSRHCTDESMRSFEFPSTLDAVDAAIKHILNNRS
eukprot:g7342.t1